MFISQTAHFSHIVKKICKIHNECRKGVADEFSCKFCVTKLDCKPKAYLKPCKRSAAPANEGDFWVRALFLCNSVKKQIFFLRPFGSTYISKLQYSLICDFYANFSKYFIDVLQFVW